ncbi:MAG: thiamine pyrophosphate-binding protein, partial [Candidatus Riflebacteria bacterium]|nr:thiamine pyrophosphate-binding protein [Candidatus Riflebacteria bacterium]
TSPLRVGLIGSYGNRWANKALGESDLLIVMGSRLDVRQTGSDKDYLTTNRIVWHIDCDKAEIGAQVKGCKPVVGHLLPVLDRMVELAENNLIQGNAWDDWITQIAEFRQKWPDTDELSGIEGINPNSFFHVLSKYSRAAATFVTDVGQHQMWAAQSLELSADQRFITSGGMGAMGFALPGAIGSAVAMPGRPVVAIVGDGGMQMNIQELETVKHNRLPVKIVVINNASLGMVRQFQESYFASRFQSTVVGYSAPDFTRVAEAYGIKASSVATPEEVEAGLSALWNDPAEPYLLEVMIDPKANVYPKIAYGYPLTEMEPFVTPIEMECT